MLIGIGDSVRVKKDVSNLPMGMKPGFLLKVKDVEVIHGYKTYKCYWKDNDSIINFDESEIELVDLGKKAEVSSGGALRYNKGKPQFSHLSPDFIMEMMKGMTAANEKYPYLNYTKAQDVRTAADSLMRHFLKFQQGMDIDEELNTHHLALVAINAMIMFQNLSDFGDEVDNRYSKEKDKVQNA